ncbi:uncharacterized protein K460DRAFT_358722 [Cucurbitaria berberidis CBS 394.84]|uniref:Uncharacterized protein n=1 Tax=Cucurbitaria berberidis CBS 394.84 TaxID=1168544 RepID=A0A9P4GB67_9PLEO|nr:uncharacterized protein K460DRAFT_358722 [Cucurbitaria berberidis CBS 394.84]KAF1842049.1 hypothetical protein K460DRAFT_358722 [Cucurbitaria berberidis CBS 394.84]
MAEFGGNHHQDRKIMHDTTAGFRHSDQRSTPQDTASGSTHHTAGRGSEQSATDGAANEDDDDEEEEDSSTAKDDELDVPVPSFGFGKGGKGKGKRPGIRIEPVDDDESLGEDDDIASLGAGLVPNKHPVNQLLMNNKKRTYSNLSSTSVLFGDDSTDQESFPRRKIARKLSTVASEPLLTYKESDDHVEGYENAIESDDEDYSGVNLIPDDDDDDMDFQEESYILQEEQQATSLLNEFRDARRLSLDSCASDNIFGVTAPLNDAFISSLPDFGFAQFFEPEALPASPDPAVKRKYSDSSTKRVRFDDEVQVSDSSSSESSELDSSVFPDLFLEQDKLPPVLHQLLEMDNDDDNGDIQSPMSDASFWDYGQDESRITQADHSDESDDDSSPGSSGYDSDMGDTTDEEDFGSEVPPRTPIQKQSVLRRPCSAPGSRAATPNPFQRSSRPTGRQIPPTRGVFIHDDCTKAIAVTNRATKTLTFYRPRTTMIPWIPLNGYHSSTSSTANNSPRNSIAQVNASDSEVSNEVFNNTLGTDIMLTGIFGSTPGNDYYFGNDSVGPPEAFFPFVSIGSNGNMNIMDEDEYDDSDDYEDDLNITDFMDFGSSGEDTESEQEDEMDVPATPATTSMAPPSSTPARPTPVAETPGNRNRSTSDVMLEHFDRGVVTAFRNNQNRYRDVASLPQDPAVRASVSRPVRSGKSAETLITPLRKRSRSTRLARTPRPTGSIVGNQSSPLSGVTKANSRLQNSVTSPSRGPPPRMGTFS